MPGLIAVLLTQLEVSTAMTLLNPQLLLHRPFPFKAPLQICADELDSFSLPQYLALIETLPTTLTIVLLLFIFDTLLAELPPTLQWMMAPVTFQVEQPGRSWRMILRGSEFK